VRIDLEAFTRAASAFVAAELDAEFADVPVRTAIVGDQQCGAARPVAGVQAAGGVDAVGVVWIERQAQHAHEVAIRPRQVVEQRDPAVAAGIEPIGASDIGACI